MIPHTIQQTNPTYNYSREDQTEAREQDEFRTHILLLTGISTPFDALGATILICPDNRTVAGTRIARPVHFLAMSVSRAGIRRIDARVQTSEVLRDDLW